jgi:CRP/FNR family transcriptional regulator
MSVFQQKHCIAASGSTRAVTAYKKAGEAAGIGLIALEAQRRLDKAHCGGAHVLVVRKGSLSLDASVKSGHRQIFDFLRAGDIVPAKAWLSGTGMAARALEPTVLEPVDDASPTWQTKQLFVQLEAQFTRSNQHRMLIGCLDSQERVASFLLDQAVRAGEPRSGVELSLPMSREDIADYIAINRDTLSRVTKRFEALGLTRRMNRHAVVIRDIDGLAAMTPMEHFRRVPTPKSRHGAEQPCERPDGMTSVV